MNIFTEDVNKVLVYSGNRALNRGQLKINTALVFDGVLRFFKLSEKSGKNDNMELSTKVTKTYGKYGINNKNFNDAYDSIYPASEKLNVAKPELAEDLIAALNNLTVKAQNEKRQINLTDLLCEIFSDKNYALFKVFLGISMFMETDYNAAVDAGVSQEELPPMPFDVNNFYDEMRKNFVSVQVREIKSLETEEMSKYLTNINKYIAKRSDFKLVGMEKEITSMEVALAGRTKKSAVLVGPAGTGKTSIVYELANRMNRGDERLPSMLKNCIIYELHVDALVAGTQFRGQFEQRLVDVMNALSKLKNVILFIDEFHTMIKAGSTSSDGSDTSAGNIIKPYLSRGDIWVLGATTNDEYNEYVETDKAISRRFKKVLVHEPSKEETLEIMKGVLPIDIEFFDKLFNDELIEKIYLLTTQYNLQSSNPDKALTMMESAFAYSKVCSAESKEVTQDDIIKELELEFDLNISKSKDLDTVKEAKSFLLGQDNAIDKVGDYLTMITENICDPEKPKASLLFVGPTGTGKTALAKIIAKYFTGSEKNLIVKTGSDLQNETSVNSLFGSDAGYVGFKQTSDFLAQVKQCPNSVVLFDEFEKAHPDVRKALLNILDEGFAMDKGGNKISFKNTIIIFTSNLGFGTTAHEGAGIMRVRSSGESAMVEIKKVFSPEFFARLDDIITFERLTPEVSNKLIDRYLKEINERTERNIMFSKAEINKIKKEADVDSFGARDLQQAVKKAYVTKVKEIKNKEATAANAVAAY